MRKRFAGVALLGVAFVVVWSSMVLAKKERTGIQDKGVFTDSINKYQLVIPYNWKLKTEKEPSLLRATLQKIRLERLPAGGSQGYYDSERFIPTIKIIADTTSLSLVSFCEMLLEARGKLPRQKEYFMKLDFQIQSEIESEQKLNVGGWEGIKYTLQRKYLKRVQDPRQRIGGSSPEVTVQESLFGYLIAFKRESTIYLIQCLGERATFEFEDRDYEKLLGSWRFIS